MQSVYCSIVRTYKKFKENFLYNHVELTDNADVQGLLKNPTRLVPGVEAPEVSRILQMATVPALRMLTFRSWQKSMLREKSQH